MKEYLATLDYTAWGAASDVIPKFVSLSDPAARWTGAHKGPAFFAYSDNYLIDVKFGVILDVEASRAIRQAEIGAARTMIERTEERFDLKPERLVGDTAYGAAPMLNWLVEEQGIAPHVPFSTSRSEMMAPSRAATFDMIRTPTSILSGRKAARNKWHRARGKDASISCKQARLRCMPPQAAVLPKGAVTQGPRDIHEHARDVARSFAGTEGFERSRRERKKVEMRFAHLKRILRLGRFGFVAHEAPRMSLFWLPSLRI